MQVNPAILPSVDNVSIILGHDQLFVSFPSDSSDPSNSKVPGENEQVGMSENRILLVEDNLVNVKIALRILEKMGYKADAVNNGEEALVALRKSKYNIVLMDIQMPVMDGIMATRNIRNNFGEDQPYIIAVTANVTPTDRKNCFDAGMNDFVSKPIRPDILRQAIEKAPRPEANSEIPSSPKALS